MSARKINLKKAAGEKAAENAEETTAVTTETKGVISRCQVGPSQAVIVVPDRVDTANCGCTTR